MVTGRRDFWARDSEISGLVVWEKRARRNGESKLTDSRSLTLCKGREVFVALLALVVTPGLVGAASKGKSVVVPRHDGRWYVDELLWFEKGKRQDAI